MHEMIGIYKITSPNGRIYIGQSRDIKRRIREYKRHSAKNQPKLQKSLDKYGFNNHTFEVLECCSIEDLNNKERYYQVLHNSTSQQNLNCCLQESNNKPRVYNEEFRAKISKAHKGRIFSNSTIIKIRASAEGRIFDAATKQKMSESRLGKTFGESTRTKMSLARKGKKHSKDTILKRVANLNRNIVCNIVGLEFKSVLKVSQHFNLSIHTIRSMMNNRKENHLNLRYK